MVLKNWKKEEQEEEICMLVSLCEIEALEINKKERKAWHAQIRVHRV